LIGSEYPLEHRRYDHSEYEPFWAAAAALDLPLSLHTATRRQGKIRGAGDKTLRDASSRATKAFYPAGEILAATRVAGAHSDILAARPLPTASDRDPRCTATGLGRANRVLRSRRAA
jgi:hypothetical protein